MIYILGLFALFFGLIAFYFFRKYRKLKLKDKSLSKAFEISREGIYYMNLESQKTELSDSYYRLLGYVPGEINFDMNDWVSHIYPSDREWVTSVYDKIESKEDTYISIEYRLLTKNNTYIWVLDRSRVVAYNESGNAIKSIGTIIQIDQIKAAEKEIQDKNKKLELALSELKKSQTQLIEMEKMATMGMLTSGIAYELNNPLNYVKGNVHPLKNDFAEVSDFVFSVLNNDEFRKSSFIKTLIGKYDLDELFAEIKTLLDGIEVGAQKSSDIVKTLKMFSDDQNAEKPAVLNLHENINSAIQLLHRRIKSHITIHKNYGEIQLVNGWPGKLNQVFTSLICNSIEAIDPAKKGNIYISTYQEEEEVHLVFEDDGCGISKNIKDKIFDPFFTTKHGYNGLGLSIVKTVLDSHNGKIKVSEFDQKTRVHITIPVTLEIPA